jgi:nucleotide-binding universal stress UspA family protein
LIEIKAEARDLAQNGRGKGELTMYSNILVAVDLAHGAVADRILRVARRLVGAEGRVTALYVAEAMPDFIIHQLPADASEAHRTDARGRLDALVAAADPAAEVVVRQGAAAAMILEEAGARNADVIIVGSHRPGLRDYLLGSTASRVVRHAACSVLVDRDGALTP